MNPYDACDPLQRHPEFDLFGFDFVTTTEWIVMTFEADFHVPHRRSRNKSRVSVTCNAVMG